MRAMILERPGQPLAAVDRARPDPGEGQVLLRVAACGVCRTDLHVLDGELTDPKLPLVLGHEIVGTVVDIGAGVERFEIGKRVGVPWLGWTCGVCASAASGRENLCDARGSPATRSMGAMPSTWWRTRGTASHSGGRRRRRRGAAALRRADRPSRAPRQAGDVETLGLYGFGAAAHIVAQIARAEGRRVFAFTRARRRGGAGVRPRGWERSGPVAPTRRRLRRSEPPSCSPRSGRSCPPRSAPWTRAAWSSAPAST